MMGELRDSLGKEYEPYMLFYASEMTGDKQSLFNGKMTARLRKQSIVCDPKKLHVF